ncbi:hypothetical protein IscW_ISCW006534 [Ixodes scapularis]|uniref:Uncharacterized protein n=1 Tax=Ixodes scapularis TaxID=6945 RepID=B7PPF4_IXOSC|nr:hypothetical protein IscW_ISCW006534 [Ixodes scapularis]|eukprot:XP_002435646.1 hypothetical protein IscW_ISCW006534 [Ixodes scapularis]
MYNLFLFARLARCDGRRCFHHSASASVVLTATRALLGDLIEMPCSPILPY